MGARKGIVTAGTWCVDLNKSIADWPAEDTSNEVLAIDRQGGGSGCNMAFDLKRLDPDLPVETMGVVGDDDDGALSVRPVRRRRRRALAGCCARRRRDG